MKELTIEEKARRYDEAINAAKDALNDGTISNNTIAYLQDIFNELKESEDEKIRKWIIDDIRYNMNNEPLNNSEYKKEAERAIAWLEKQGEQKPAEWHSKDEQNLNACLGYIPDEFLRRWLMDVVHVEYDKPADKTEPKFKVGDWITNGEYTWKVTDIKSLDYILQSQDYNIVDDNISYVDDQFRLWTITDAKDGDVLAAHECFVLFKKIDGLNIRCYCAYHYMDKPSFYRNTLQNKDAFYPATKEQHYTIMKAMADAGYTFDFDKKELKKIEQKPADKVEPKFHVGDWIVQENFGVYKVIEICKSWYEVIDTDGNHYSICFDNEYICHLWTIQDAKDGDILVDIYNNIGIFQECKGIYWTSHIYLGCDGELLGFNVGAYHRQAGAHPATKEQRDLLFQKMKDAGYKWP